MSRIWTDFLVRSAQLGLEYEALTQTEFLIWKVEAKLDQIARADDPLA